jgi:regulator of sigma E protease
MFDFLPEFLRTPVAFVLVLSVLVFVHEFGHYLVARWCGVHVETFSIGFGRALVSWTDRRGTLWKVAWIPLGGFVKLHGQEHPEEVSDEVRAGWQPGRTFHEKRVGARALVVAAGPAANFLLAAVLFAVLFATIGRQVAVPVIGEVVPNSAAARAGIAVGDRIEAIDGTPIARFEQIQRMVSASAGRTLQLQVLSGGVTREIAVKADVRDNGGHPVGLLGVRGSRVEYEPVALWAAIPAGIAQTWDVSEQTLVGVWQMVTQNRGTEDLGGPLRIAQLSGQVAELGTASLLSFIALLSVNLGLINLFPIPVLDGGHLLFYLVEAVRGRPLPPRAQEYGLRAGLALLVGLFVFATWNDLTHIGLFRWVAGVIG